MIGVALPLGSAVESGALMSMSLFFMTGLPGGINYALLFAERNGWICRETEKAINVPVHEWLRGPGCVATAALILGATFSSPAATGWQRVAGVLIAALTYWNGIYFASQVLRASVRRALTPPDSAPAHANNTAHTQATSQGTDPQ